MGIRENIAEIKAKAGSARIVAVTKNVEIPQIIEAIEAGVTDIGENRVQEAKTKYSEIKSRFPSVKWHMIGHLQKNKVKAALLMFDVIQSVDSFELAEEINKHADRIVECFIEVNTSGEASKYGIRPQDLPELLEAISNLNKIKVTGLMTMGPLTKDKDLIRRSFKKLRELRDAAQLKHLSMGMSDDYSLAIEEGSDIIRIGRLIFNREA